LVSRARVLLCHLKRVLSEDRHELVRGRPIVRDDCRASFFAVRELSRPPLNHRSELGKYAAVNATAKPIGRAQTKNLKIPRIDSTKLVAKYPLASASSTRRVGGISHIKIFPNMNPSAMAAGAIENIMRKLSMKPAALIPRGQNCSS